MVEVHVHPGQNDGLIAVLNIGELPGQVAYVMVIHKRDRPDRLFIVVPLLPDQIVSDQIPQRLRSVRILAFLDVQIEIIKQMVV
jgi:hypothetical protein